MTNRIVFAIPASNRPRSLSRLLESIVVQSSISKRFQPRDLHIIFAEDGNTLEMSERLRGAARAILGSSITYDWWTVEAQQEAIDRWCDAAGADSSRFFLRSTEGKGRGAPTLYNFLRLAFTKLQNYRDSVLWHLDDDQELSLLVCDGNAPVIDQETSLLDRIGEIFDHADVDVVTGRYSGDTTVAFPVMAQSILADMNNILRNGIASQIPIENLGCPVEEGVFFDFLPIMNRNDTRFRQNYYGSPWWRPAVSLRRTVDRFVWLDDMLTGRHPTRSIIKNMKDGLDLADLVRQPRGSEAIFTGNYAFRGSGRLTPHVIPGIVRVAGIGPTFRLYYESLYGTSSLKIGNFPVLHRKTVERLPWRPGERTVPEAISFCRRDYVVHVTGFTAFLFVRRLDLTRLGDPGYRSGLPKVAVEAQEEMCALIEQHFAGVREQLDRLAEQMKVSESENPLFRELIEIVGGVFTDELKQQSQDEARSVAARTGLVEEIQLITNDIEAWEALKNVR